MRFTPVPGAAGAVACLALPPRLAADTPRGPARRRGDAGYHGPERGLRARARKLYRQACDVGYSNACKELRSVPETP